MMMQQIEFRAMHCQMSAMVDSSSPRVAERLTQVPKWFANWEQRLTRFQPDSELSQLNRRAGQTVPVSSLMKEVLQAAQQAVQESGGLVTPTILEALEIAGYDHSFESLAFVPGAWPFPETGRATIQAPALQIHPHHRTVYLAPGSQLDLGGIAKGWAADRAARRLSKWGPALVDAGGDIAIYAPRLEDKAWPVGVADPFVPDRQLALLMIKHGGIATSGRDYRRWLKNGTWQHHIIDPRTGQPAQTDILTATVIAPNARAAEVAAKVVLILGSSAGYEWLETHPKMAGMMVLESGQVIQSHRWSEFLWRKE
jgi:thiamine biosynthesis lipoprotein